MVKRVLLFVVATLWVAAALQAETFSVPAGTKINCRLAQVVSTKTNFQNDPFTATVTEPLTIGGKQIIPLGSTIDGRIAWLVRPGRTRGVGEMRLDIEKVTFPDGRGFTLNAVLVNAYGVKGAKVQNEEGNVKGPSSRMKDIQMIGMGMGGGGFVGVILGGAHGAVIGGAIGGGAALANALVHRGADLTLPTGTQLEYQLTRELVVNSDGPRQTASVRSEDIR
jgi:hypothetical protein